MNEIQTVDSLKETKEVLALITSIAKFVYTESKGDGLDFSDLGKLMLDRKFQKGLAEAVSGSSIVVDELKDLTSFESFNLARFLLDSAEDILFAGNQLQEKNADDSDNKIA